MNDGPFVIICCRVVFVNVSRFYSTRHIQSKSCARDGFIHGALLCTSVMRIRDFYGFAKETDSCESDRTSQGLFVLCELPYCMAPPPRREGFWGILLRFLIITMSKECPTGRICNSAMASPCSSRNAPTMQSLDTYSKHRYR